MNGVNRAQGLGLMAQGLSNLIYFLCLAPAGWKAYPSQPACLVPLIYSNDLATDRVVQCYDPYRIETGRRITGCTTRIKKKDPISLSVFRPVRMSKNHNIHILKFSQDPFFEAPLGPRPMDQADLIRPYFHDFLFRKPLFNLNGIHIAVNAMEGFFA